MYGPRKVVGQVKALGDRFTRRGRRAARSEFRLLCVFYNLLKLVLAGVARWKGRDIPLPQPAWGNKARFPRPVPFTRMRFP